MGEPALPRLERPFPDGLLALCLSAEAHHFPFAEFAEALVRARQGSIAQKLDGLDEVYWDLVLDGRVLTLHRQHYLGVFLCASDEASEGLLRDLVPLVGRCLRELRRADP